MMPEELDLSDEEMEELMEFGRNYQDEETLSRMVQHDISKEVDKAITQTLKEESSGP